MKKRRFLVLFWVAQIIAVVFASVLIYAREHPESRSYEVLTEVGFHLDK